MPCARRSSMPTAASRGPNCWSTPPRRMTRSSPPSRRWPTAASWWRGRTAALSGGDTSGSPCARRFSTPTAASRAPSSWSTPRRESPGRSHDHGASRRPLRRGLGRTAARPAATLRQPSARRCSTPTAARRGPNSWSTPRRRIIRSTPPSRRWPMGASWWRGRIQRIPAATPSSVRGARADLQRRRQQVGGRVPGQHHDGDSSQNSPPSRHWPTAASWWRGRIFSHTGGDTSGNGRPRRSCSMPTAARSGAEFLVNTTTTNDQHSPTITALADGRFAVAWTDLQPDWRRYVARGRPRPDLRSARAGR